MINYNVLYTVCILAGFIYLNGKHFIYSILLITISAGLNNFIDYNLVLATTVFLSKDFMIFVS